MPISVESHALTQNCCERFQKVLRDDADYAQALQQAAAGQSGRLFAAHFNGQPVALALLDEQAPALRWVVVHPATRGRGVARDLLRLVEQQLGSALSLPDDCRR